MASAIHERKPDDYPVFPEEYISKDRSDEWSEVERAIEKMNQLGGSCLAHRQAVAAIHVVQILREEDSQDRLHAVEREPLGRLVADDVGDPRRHPVQLLRLRPILHVPQASR